MSSLQFLSFFQLKKPPHNDQTVVVVFPVIMRFCPLQALKIKSFSVFTCFLSKPVNSRKLHYSSKVFQFSKCYRPVSGAWVRIPPSALKEIQSACGFAACGLFLLPRFLRLKNPLFSPDFRREAAVLNDPSCNIISMSDGILFPILTLPRM